MSKNYLLEPRVSEEDRIWAEQHYEVKRLNEQIERSKKIGKGVIFVVALIWIVMVICIIGMVSDMANPNVNVEFTGSVIALLFFIGLIVLMLILLLVVGYNQCKTGDKRLITKKNLYIETLVEEKNANQANNLTEGGTNE